jgi:16S rRNA (guanine966-N2)-methyltransferase
VRETLFNWLQPNIAGARCADLFAGTGALGFEAASRGAAAVTLVERSFDLAARLRQSVEMLSASQVFVAQADALEWLGAQPEKSLDLVFIDPPFDTDLAARALARLRERGCLAPGGRVYLERPKSEARTPHAGYLVAREKQMGEVHIALLEAIAAE